jgi:anaerobic sulfite reductase subunit B
MHAEPLTTSMTPVIAPIESVVHDLADTVTLSMDMPVELAMPVPGQFAMLWVPGIGEIPISYSGIGPGRRVDHTVRAVGATSASLAALEPGHPVGIRGPFGRGWRLGDLAGADVLIIAGGLGLAPLRPVVEAADELGARSVRLLVGARSPDLVLYAAQIEARWDALHPQVTVDHASTRWRGPVGPLTLDLAGALEDPDAVAALVCGPEIMMNVLCRQLTAAGARGERIQVSLERNMHCGVGLCGHCQIGPLFACVDGPVVDWGVAARLLAVRER